jgi:hypothetical protein
MDQRTASWVAWSLCGLSLVLTGAGIGLLILLNLSYQGVPIYDYWADATAIAVSFSIVGAIIASRRPEHPVGWLFCTIGVLAAVDHLCGEYATYALLGRSDSLLAGEAAAWVRSWIWTITGGLGVFLLLVFPDGRLPSERWKYLAWLNAVVAVGGAVALAFSPGPIDGLEPIRNPLGIGPDGSTSMASVVNLVEVLQVGIALAATASPFVRLRHARLEQRQQIKWFAYAVAILIIGRLLASPATEALGTGWISSVGFAIYVIGIMGVPLAVGIAILRHHLYDIDLIIRRTLVYGSLTLLLAAVYFGGVALIGAIFQALTLREDQPQLVIVVTTLVIAALFNPLRRRIQGFIDRRFYRSRYDANKVLQILSVKLRDETDLDWLTRELVGVVGQTMQPAHLSLWLSTGADSSDRQLDQQPSVDRSG